MINESVVTQNPRDFTVRILKLPDENIVGTGLAVSLDGKIVTCAHVILAAGVNPEEKDGGEVGVYFPKPRSGEVKLHRAKVAAYFPENDDDVVLLQLLDGPAPLAPEQIPTLGRAIDSQGNPFRSYGYRRMEDYQAGWAMGYILGHVESPQGRILLEEPVQLDSKQINCGMSGSGVLDLERNLVIGVVSETWFPDQTSKDRDTAWAVDARVLSLQPLGLPVHDQALPKRGGLISLEETDATVGTMTLQSLALYNVPEVAANWVGRVDLLRCLDSDWQNPSQKVTGIIGLGGEGKSSLARQWLYNLLNNNEMPQPQGVFWWGFNEKRSVEEFLTAALNFFSREQLDPREFPSIAAQAHLVAGLLARGRYLLVLDGLEVLQHQEGDRFGEITSRDLREFIMFLATPGHQSYTLITSRAPLLDLLNYTTYGEMVLNRLSQAEGLSLLRQLGITGNEENLEELVIRLDGHALTLSLLGEILKDKYGSDIGGATELLHPIARESQYENVKRMLRHYDGIITKAEREFLTIFSAFRLPLHVSAVGKVFRMRFQKYKDTALGRMGKVEFAKLRRHLQDCGLLQLNSESKEYTAHPLIRDYYSQILLDWQETNPGIVKGLHRRIKDYYLERGGKLKRDDKPLKYPTLQELTPYIEAIHHACMAGDYDEANLIRYRQLDQGERFVMAHELGAYETYLSILSEFFPAGNLGREPLVSDGTIKSFIMNDTGLTLMSLGRLSDAEDLYERSLKILEKMGVQGLASPTYQNLAELYSVLGELSKALQAADLAKISAENTCNPLLLRDSLTSKAWVYYLQGNLSEASSLFSEAESLQREFESKFEDLYSNRGNMYAEFLCRIGERNKALQISNANLKLCKEKNWLDNLSRSHRILGQLAADMGDFENAHESFRKALNLARSISQRDILIEALSAQGRWLVQIGEAEAAQPIFEEGLVYSTAGGYRILEVDLRVGRAQAYIKVGNRPAAMQEVELATSMSREMGYHWGEEDTRKLNVSLD